MLLRSKLKPKWHSVIKIYQLSGLLDYELTSQTVATSAGFATVDSWCPGLCLVQRSHSINIC